MDDRSAVRVVIVDDSPTAQELLVALLQAADGIEVVGVGGSGEDAVRLTKRLRPSVVTMDVHMPGMDGLEATRRIMCEAPTPIVIVTASVMRAGTNLTFDALQAGALTVVRKPGLADPETGNRVIQAVRLMASVQVVRRWSGKGKRSPDAVEAGRDPEEKPAKPAAAPSPATDRRERRRVRIIGIAASTGGPGALATVLRQLSPDLSTPIVLVQHITNGFAIGLAEWLDSQVELPVSLAGHGQDLRGGGVFLAPDDYHVRVNNRGVVELDKEQPYKGLRPSANYMFSSLARAYGRQAVGIVLTGMGDDGAEGLMELRESGGLAIAQEEQSCVVYGMPREAVAQGAVDRVLSLEEIAAMLNGLAADS